MKVTGPALHAAADTGIVRVPVPPSHGAPRMAIDLADRFRGCLLGLAWATRSARRRFCRAKLRGPGSAARAVGLQPGQWTDDT